jgi:nucleoside 2-deoxyribosyltransferase
MRRSIYVVGPLFSDAERHFNCALAAVLRARFDVFLPQESGYLLRDMVADGEDVQKSMRIVFERDVAAIRTCDLFLVILDGRAVDEGAAFELGVAFSAGKRCYGLQTDWRQLLPIGQNPMIATPLTKIFYGVDELRRWVESPSFENQPPSTMAAVEPAGA